MDKPRISELAKQRVAFGPVPPPVPTVEDEARAQAWRDDERCTSEEFEKARQIMFDVLASVDDEICRAVGCYMPRNLGSYYCGDHETERAAKRDGSR